METDLSPELGRHGFRRRLSRTWIQGKEGGRNNDVPLVEFMYLVFTRMPGERYRRRVRSLLLYLCYIFRSLINSLAC